MTPLVMSEDEVQQMQYGPAIAAARSYQQQFTEAWAGIEPLGWATRDELAWSLTMVQSRVLRIAQLGRRVMVPGIGRSGGGGCLGGAGNLESS